MVVKGLVDDLDVKKLLPFREGLFEFILASHGKLEEAITKEGVLSKELEAEIKKVVLEYKKSFFSLQSK